MGKKTKRKANQAIEEPIEVDLEAEAAYYARKVGITVQEAAKIIREARAPKLSIVRKDGRQAPLGPTSTRPQTTGIRHPAVTCQRILAEPSD
ncbi:hypothetical protein EN804_25030 [Mesorhizobium sp. M8A.F.Ca.ET.161.01.1.1]|nr:hypothetical protein EN804_25030 [Mesorhizobium sp. M8A.F.Ca.ET.161.01.1.1]TGV38099.1 hypothetical protein EN785_25015 [Mesorhizobium sp. M8A.F.Ca.ET.142.01.1.1]